MVDRMFLLAPPETSFDSGMYPPVCRISADVAEISPINHPQAKA